MSGCWKDSEVNDCEAGKEIYILSQDSKFPQKISKPSRKNREVCFSATSTHYCSFLFLFLQPQRALVDTQLSEDQAQHPEVTNPKTPWATVIVSPAHLTTTSTPEVSSKTHEGNTFWKEGCNGAQGPILLLAWPPRTLYIVRNTLSS